MKSEMEFTSLIFAALMSVTLYAQTAKVISVSAKDAAERQSLEDQRTAIEQKIKDLDGRLRRQYTTVLEGDKDASNSYADSSAFLTSATGAVTGCIQSWIISGDANSATKEAYDKCQKELAAERIKNPPSKHRMYRRGWEYGIVYSEGFKFIVPQEAPKWPVSSGGINPYCVQYTAN